MAALLTGRGITIDRQNHVEQQQNTMPALLGGQMIGIAWAHSTKLIYSAASLHLFHVCLLIVHAVKRPTKWTNRLLSA